jgi:hypothetical protein
MHRTIVKTMSCACLMLLSISETRSAEWGTWPASKGSPYVAAGFRHDDGGALVIACDPKARLISIVIGGTSRTLGDGHQDERDNAIR